jgi:hypothetical protein
MYSLRMGIAVRRTERWQRPRWQSCVRKKSFRRRGLLKPFSPSRSWNDRPNQYDCADQQDNAPDACRYFVYHDLLAWQRFRGMGWSRELICCKAPVRATKTTTFCQLDWQNDRFTLTRGEGKMNPWEWMSHHCKQLYSLENTWSWLLHHYFTKRLEDFDRDDADDEVQSFHER